MVVESVDHAVLPRADCFRLLAQAVIGRVVFTAAAMPAVQPVRFVLDDEAVVFGAHPGSRLVTAIRDAVVAFEVDEFDAAGRTGWSVIVTGRAYPVQEPSEIERLSRLSLSLCSSGQHTAFVMIRPEFVSGRRLGDAPTAAS